MGNEDLGKLGPGDEVYKGMDPFLVCMNKLKETASLQYSTSDGMVVDQPISLDTALGLIRDLGMKVIEQGESPKG